MHNSFEMPTSVNRRNFLQSSIVGGGALLLSFHLPLFSKKALGAAAEPRAIQYPANAFIKVERDGTTTITINKLEMGQGVNTSMAQLIAEEMDCDWKKVRSESAGVNAVYNHTHFGTQMTGGSSALISSYDQYRKIGASARAQFVQAAAEEWKVPAESLHTESGFVVHKEKGKISYGDLIDRVATQPEPTNVKLKDPKQFKIIGKSMPRVDAIDKSNGQAKFGIDVQIPGMLYCVVARAPVFGAKIKSVDDTTAKSIRGVKQVIALPDRVAVLAENSWAAKQGRDAIKVSWETTGKESVSDDSILAEYKELAKKPGAVAENLGDAAGNFAKSKTILEAEYHFPYLAHACMETMNCTINYDGNQAEIWSGHQMPTIDRDVAAGILGLAKEKVKVNTTYAGGSFGRRANKNSDYVTEACMIAKVAKKPLKVFWTREDDMQGGYYRPFMYHKAKIGLDTHGNPHAWDHKVVGQSVVGDSFFESMMVKNGVDPTAIEGVAGSPYSIPNRHVELTLTKQHVPVLWWRSVGHTHTAFVMETLIDELATTAKQDALKFRQNLLKKSPRHLAVLSLLENHSPWKKKPSKGHAYGLAIHESFASVVGYVVDVSMDGDRPKVNQVWAAVHCGKVVNPEGAKAQIEGALVYGLTAALYGKVPIKEGKPTVTNFSDYPVMRISEMPKVETYFVETNAPPTGLGEPGTPPIAPAVANAYFHLTKKRIRSLPFA